MARNDVFENPTPVGNASKKTVDGVLKAFQIGNNMVSLLSGLLASVLILYSGYVLYDSFSAQAYAYTSAWDLLQYKPEVTDAGTPSDGAAALAAINNDYRAWVTMYETNIDYPVVQGSDDLYYASHDIYGNGSLTGAIYLAAGNGRNFSDSYNLLYGHHMDNGAMFGSLDRYKSRGYFNEHQEGILVTNDGVYDITLFAVATTDAYETQIYDVSNGAGGVKSFLTGDRSQDVGVGTELLIWDGEVAASAGKVLAMSTCADAETNGRLVVFGRMTPHEFPTVNLRIRYLYDQTNTEAFPTKEFTFNLGEDYRVVSPKLEGYEPDIRTVKGLLAEDTEITVRYKTVMYPLTVYYMFLDGRQAAATYENLMVPGEEYEIVSPEIEGYKASVLSISGTKLGWDEKHTVIYLPEDTQLVEIDEYGTPFGTGQVNAQKGICIE